MHQNISVQDEPKSNYKVTVCFSNFKRIGNYQMLRNFTNDYV